MDCLVFLVWPSAKSVIPSQRNTDITFLGTVDKHNKMCSYNKYVFSWFFNHGYVRKQPMHLVVFDSFKTNLRLKYKPKPEDSTEELNIMR